MCALARDSQFLLAQPLSCALFLPPRRCRFWCKLHCLSARGGAAPCLPVLAATFLNLLEAVEPALTAHLSSLGCPAVSIALPWITSAFVEVLPVQEVLLLWDRVIGLDSLLVLPVAAAALLAWRAQLLRAAQSIDDVATVLEDWDEVQVVPLLQALLFLSAPRD